MQFPLMQEVGANLIKRRNVLKQVIQYLRRLSTIKVRRNDTISL
jgi:hypothetical protein